MPYQIFINREQESENDNISIFYYDPTFIVSATKDDLPRIKLIDESQKPGIYILLGDNKCYVGQASNSILSRLQQHSINKNWWNKIIFFGREDDRLSKAQLDFLEHRIIEKMSATNISLDNNTQGNKSYIDKLSESSAVSLLNKVEKVLNDIANINLIDLEIIETEDNNEYSSPNDDISIIFGDSLYTGESCRSVFMQVVSNLVLSVEFDKLSSLVSPKEPTTVQIIGNKDRISAKGIILTKPIEKTRYHLYVNFSKVDLYKQIKKLSELIGKKVIFERW